MAFINITIRLIRKVIFSIWNAVKLTVVNYKFSKILIFLWKLEFYYWWQMLSDIFLEVTIFSSFEKMSANIQFYTTVVYQLFFQVKKTLFLKTTTPKHSSKQ